jgi:EAL domain-containing protein (putative c-di-GMP-specific phosphodiesterase class I)
MSESLTPANSAAPPADSRQRRDPSALLGQRLVRLLTPLRVRRLSLHDSAGTLLWLSDGELDRVQRRCIQEAQDAFALDPNLEHLERDLAEGSRGHFFSVRTPTGERIGLAFAMVSSRRRPHVDSQALLERVFATLRRFSGDLPLPVPGAGPDAAAQSESESQTSADVSLRSRPYVRLRPGGTTRRCEITLAASTSRQQDLHRATRLLQLLQRRDARESRAPATFALPLCVASVLTAEFLEQLAAPLQQAGIATDMLGFCLPAAAWEADPAATERFIERSGEHGCFIALDDFNLTAGGFGLLRAGAVRCLKLDAALISNVLTDKFAHASVVAIVKAARVLGLYCVAKGVKRTATARWLASNGVEFAERSSRRATAGATTGRARELTLAPG